MSFVSTAFLIALPLVAAPLLLHLFDRRRNEVIQWGAMQFLMEASAKKTSARRLKQWLLLLLRCLAIAALILALAGPLLPAGYLGGGGRGETIFVVDNSMSMSRKTASGTMIGDAASRAIERLGELPSRDDVRIMTTAPYPSWIGTGTVRSDSRNQKWLAEQLHGIDATQGRSDLLAALFTAVQVQHEPTQHSRKIVVLTDGQAADWRLDDQTGWKRLQTALGQAPVPTKIETIRLDQSATQSKIG
ncbi:MAG: BatA domain-containing protein, partial [Planctomycetales bacterium]|nr:BatA domain-containing protein [Planctomycetales bacterium]